MPSWHPFLFAKQLFFRYTNLELTDRFALMNVAFSQKGIPREPRHDVGKKGETEVEEGGGISDSGADYGYDAQTWPPEEAESLWDDSDDGFFERFYSDADRAAAVEEAWKAEEGPTRIRRCWNPEAGTELKSALS